MRWGKIFLLGNEVEIGTKLDWENYSTTVEEAIKTATIIDGVPFLNLQETIKFKKAIGREDSKNHPIQMKLQEKPFDLIKKGAKILELRLYDAKRKNIKIGDVIEFSKLPELVEKISVQVIGLLVCKTFAELIEDMPAKYLGYTEPDKEYLKTSIYEIYSKEEEGKYGVLGIRIKLV